MQQLNQLLRAPGAAPAFLKTMIMNGEDKDDDDYGDVDDDNDDEADASSVTKIKCLKY